MKKRKGKKLESGKTTRGISLLDILDKRLIVPDFQAKTKEDVLDKIVDRFCKKGIISKPAFFRMGLKYVEMTERTVHRGIAYSWAPSTTNHNSIAGLFINRKGVNFGWFRSRPKRTQIFMVVTGKPEKLIKCIYGFNLLLHSKLAKYKGFKEELIKAKSVNEVISIIREYESRSNRDIRTSKRKP